MSLLRIAVAIGALLVAAWLAFSLRAVSLQEEGEETLDRARRGPVSSAEVVEAQNAFRRADRLNPDLAPLLGEGFLLVAAGRPSEAFPYGARAVAKEPENVQAWTLAYLAAPGRRQARRAKLNVRELNPWLAESLR